CRTSPAPPGPRLACGTSSVGASCASLAYKRDYTCALRNVSTKKCEPRSRPVLFGIFVPRGPKLSPQNTAKRSKVLSVAYPMPSLASLFRERVKALLTFSGATQTALAIAMKRDRAKVSRLLASDEEASIVTVEQ